MTARIVLEGRLICDPEDVGPVLGALPDHVRLSRAEEGCESFDVRQDSSDPCIFHVAESFRDRDAFQAHQDRTRASAWWAMTGHIRREFEMREA